MTKLFSLMGEIAIDGVSEAKNEIQGVATEGEKAKDSLGKSFQEMGQKAGELGNKLALGLAGAVTGAVALVESTRELRQDLGKLETTFKTTNQETGAAERTFKALYGVLGEDDTSIEAANHLAQLTNNEKDLNQWTDILTGVYATFGDSLPLEGLAEASNETAKVGTVTGGLADALNWAGVSEDEFNAKLEKCNTEAEREKLIRETLIGIYGEASDTYKDINGEVIKGNEAQADMNLKMAEMAEKLQPLITQGKILLMEVLDKLSPILTFIVDNFSILAPIVLGFLTTLFALSIASKIQALIPIIMSLNTVMAANPIGMIIIAIGLLVTAFVTLWNNCESFRNFWINLWNNIKNITSTAINGIKTFFTNIIDFVKNNWQSLLLLLVNPFAGAFKLLYDNCEGFRKFVDNFVKSVKDFFVNGFNTIKEKVVSTVTNLVDGAKNKFNAFKNSVTTIFNNVKSAITKPIETARDVVKGVVDKIKGFFNFKVSLPKIKLPHFGITPSGWQIGDLMDGVIPKLGIEWYAKGAILHRPTAFGVNGSNLMVGGEAGAEAIAPISELMKYTTAAVDGSNAGLEHKLDRLIGLLSNYLPELTQRQVVLSTGELVGAMVNPLDKALGDLANRKGRGY